MEKVIEKSKVVARKLSGTAAISYNKLCDRVERVTLRSLTTSVKHTDIIEQSRILCEDYIYHRLQDAYCPDTASCDGLVSVEPCDELDLSDVSQEIQEIGSTLEMTYPSLYVNLSHQLSMPLRSQVAVRKALICIGDSIFRGQPPVITWCRIIGLFAVAGTLARECSVNGNPELIGTVVTTFTELVDRYLSSWIYKQGGWIKVTKRFRVNDKLVRTRVYVTTLAAAFGFSFVWCIVPSTFQY